MAKVKNFDKQILWDFFTVLGPVVRVEDTLAQWSPNILYPPTSRCILYAQSIDCMTKIELQCKITPHNTEQQHFTCCKHHCKGRSLDVWGHCSSPPFCAESPWMCCWWLLFCFCFQMLAACRGLSWGRYVEGVFYSGWWCIIIRGDGVDHTSCPLGTSSLTLHTGMCWCHFLPTGQLQDHFLLCQICLKKCSMKFSDPKKSEEREKRGRKDIK